MAMLLTMAVASGAAGVMVWTAGEARRWKLRQQQGEPQSLGPVGEGVQICGEMLLALTLLLLAVHFCS